MRAGAKLHKDTVDAQLKAIAMETVHDILKTVRPENESEYSMWTVDKIEKVAAGWNFSISARADYIADGGIKFQDLDKLSAAFETKEIDLDSQTGSEGYCDSCYSEFTETVIHFRNAQLFS